MKKLISFMFILVSILSLVSCKKNNAVDKSGEERRTVDFDEIRVPEKTMNDEEGKTYLNKIVGINNSEYDLLGIYKNYNDDTDDVTQYITHATISFKKEMLDIIIGELKESYFHTHGTDENDEPIEWYTAGYLKKDIKPEQLYIKNILEDDESFNPVMDDTERIECIVEIIHENLHERNDEYADNEYTAMIEYTEYSNRHPIHRQYINEDGVEVYEIEIPLKEK